MFGTRSEVVQTGGIATLATLAEMRFTDVVTTVGTLTGVIVTVDPTTHPTFYSIVGTGNT
ncbi:hypothetical protein [Halopenitus malekzadehii]|uniref:hypothetical protein n=1 Tax=Halopenitus malekzadehii TaxID=1267564 RepID=UPI0015A59352|nr:hypothetical protein [Halopenitus malekzadehii]